jgi:hypothetical protein
LAIGYRRFTPSGLQPPGLWHPASGIWYLASGIWYPASGIWYPASGIWYLPSGLRESGGGPPQSKTLRAYPRAWSGRQLLECASPLALSPRAPALRHLGSGIWDLASGIRPLASGIWHLVRPRKNLPPAP